MKLTNKEEELVNAVRELAECDGQDVEVVRNRVESAINWIVRQPRRAVCIKWDTTNL